MMDEQRYIFIPFNEVTQPMIEQCIQTSMETLRHVKLVGDATDYVVLKWKGIKPFELLGEFPVYSDLEAIDILNNDLNRVKDGTSN